MDGNRWPGNCTLSDKWLNGIAPRAAHQQTASTEGKGRRGREQIASRCSNYRARSSHRGTAVNSVGTGWENTSLWRGVWWWGQGYDDISFQSAIHFNLLSHLSGGLSDGWLRLLGTLLHNLNCSLVTQHKPSLQTRQSRTCLTSRPVRMWFTPAQPQHLPVTSFFRGMNKLVRLKNKIRLKKWDAAGASC